MRKYIVAFSPLRIGLNGDLFDSEVLSLFSTCVSVMWMRPGSFWGGNIRING